MHSYRLGFSVFCFFFFIDSFAIRILPELSFCIFIVFFFGLLISSHGVQAGGLAGGWAAKAGLGRLGRAATSVLRLARS